DSEPAHVCAHCHLRPPDGTERAIGADGAWIHPRCEDAYIDARLAEEGILRAQDADTAPPPPPPESPPPPPESQSPPAPSPPGGNGRGDGFPFGYTDAGDRGGNGARYARGSKVEIERDTYTEEHADEPFDHAFLINQGYRLARGFDYTLADGTLLYQHNRYELRAGCTPTKKRKRKYEITHRTVKGKDVGGGGERRVIYNWPAIMRAAPGSTVFIPEGENKAEALIGAGMLATMALSHSWTPECVAALTGHHLIILADHDESGKKYAAAAQRKLAMVAASIRVVP